MFVRQFMTTPVMTIQPETATQDALRMMHQRRIRRLPVVDPDGRLVGIVSERDLLYASPSPATSLSVWELNYLLAKLQVQEIMTRNPLTTTPDAPIQEAARLMLKHKIGGLPVIESGDADAEGILVGIITESDIFRAFLSAFQE